MLLIDVFSTIRDMKDNSLVIQVSPTFSNKWATFKAFGSWRSTRMCLYYYIRKKKRQIHWYNEFFFCYDRSILF